MKDVGRVSPGCCFGHQEKKSAAIQEKRNFWRLVDDHKTRMEKGE